jgi:hypothetical protein
MKNLIHKILKEEYLKEIRVPREERLDIYRDENLIAVLPLSHRALKKYAAYCQWCINNDEYEWEHYHQGWSVIIIQRNLIPVRTGISGLPTADELLIYQRWGEGYTYNDVIDILGYDFGDRDTAIEYFESMLSKRDITYFNINKVYFNIDSRSVYDMADNELGGYGYNILDVPNITPEILKIISKKVKEYNKENGSL